MRSLLAAALVAVLLAPTGSAALLAIGSPTGGEVIVGYREGTLAQTLQTVASLGGTVLGKNEDLRYVVVETRDLAQFLLTVVLATTVEYAEKNDDTKLHGAQWNGAQWNSVTVNGAQWNGAQWNGAQWNGAQWNGAQWNGAQWNGAQWNGAQWNSGPAFDSPDPGRWWQWGLNAIGAPAAWNTTVGTRTATLCVLDSGIDLDHRDLKGNLRWGADGLLGFNALSPGDPPEDDAGHGTHMAGIAAASIGNGFGIAGVGNVTIMPVKVLDATGYGKEDDLAAGLTWCANHGAEVALMALGIDQEDAPTVRRALDYAAAHDVVLVASAGNGGCGCIGLPAKHKDVLAVGAFDPRDARASFSNTGPSLDVMAPGVDIVSTFTNGEFRFGSGTSQAAAYAAGAAALVRDHDGWISAAQTRDLLVSSARDMGAAGADPSTGAGAIDVAAALGG